MSRVALTGAGGFLGWHTRAALLETGAEIRSIPVGVGFDIATATRSVSGASRLIHIAGVNRGTDGEVRDGNVRFAQQIAQALLHSNEPPASVVFANSTQSANGSVYGDAKAAAADIVRVAAESVGAEFEDVLLPNLFGEHGRPFYNAVTATFCHLLARDELPTVENDKELILLHAQDAADMLIEPGSASGIGSYLVRETVGNLLAKLSHFARTYGRGEVPDVASDFDRNLFNAYRSHTFPANAPVPIARHADARGSFFEIIRTHGGSGQSSFSTTSPGVSRGDHFHRRKIERFTVLAGTATISLRKVFTNDVYSFYVSGEEPVAVDMPTMWAHNITNTGSDQLYTSFWTNDIFNPEAPDTISEAVQK
jgi:UDP-2-acetamido-2,6-beta-L-arabino-hexul-4-ose reductase